MKLKKLLFLIIILCSLNAEAQTSAFLTIDSLMQYGRYKKALTLLNKQPSSFLKHKKTGTIYELLDNNRLASQEYNAALGFKEDYLTKIKLANSYKKERKYNAAITTYKQLLTEDNKNLLVKYKLAKLYLATKQISKAKTSFKELIKQDNTNANYSYYLGLIYELLQSNNARIDNYLAAYKKDTQHLKAIEKLAIAFSQLNDKDSTNLFIKKGLAINPRHKNLNKLKINALYTSKKYQKALLNLQYLDSLYPNDYYTTRMLGKSYLKMDSLEKAKTYFKNAIKLDRKDFKNHTYLGEIYLKQKKYEKAKLEYFLATFIGKKKRDKVYLGLAKVYYELKEPKNVIKNYKKAVKENTNNFKALYFLATFSDNYYQDKKIAYKHYETYLNRFEYKDSVFTATAKRRIKEIKKEFFLKGEVLN